MTEQTPPRGSETPLAKLSWQLSQDLWDFKCAGAITRPEAFNARLAEYAELSKAYTKEWRTPK